MREILFRGKRKNGRGEWIYGNVNYYPNLNRWFIRLHPSLNAVPTIEDEVIPDTVGQYTGIIDKNGKKIFEGDIVKEFFWPKNIGVVSFEKGSFCSGMESFYGWIYKGVDGRTENRELYDSGDYDCAPLEVIGNIYDNPELLKGGEEYEKTYT